MLQADVYTFQILITLVSALGISFVLKDYIASIIAGIILGLQASDC